ncbi:hypothetical protein M426DRAFT_318834 [Hypoxylon sp. CI-4A]|nr:hypothetical protein M426DRAFT_318834 [Hypoxylon sp. CI-4A]
MEIPQRKLTPTYHTTAYPAISPLRPELSQAGKTVLVTGGSTGIGYAIARGFVQARARKVIILGRRGEKAVSAAATLQEEAREQKKGTEVIGLQNDVGDKEAVAKLWGKFADEGTVIDVLVLNAVAVSPTKPVLDLDLDGLWADYNVNVRSLLDFTVRFYKQEKQGAEGPKYLLHVATQAIHDWPVIPIPFPGYPLTKNAGTAALQVAAKDVKPERMQIVLFHPGGIWTESAENTLGPEAKTAMPWDDVELPGSFAVWAASPEAKFLHGRFVWAHWDVDELKTGEIRKKIDEDPAFLKVGVKGL